jgi:hypothetical protein
MCRHVIHNGWICMCLSDLSQSILLSQLHNLCIYVHAKNKKGESCDKVHNNDNNLVNIPWTHRHREQLESSSWNMTIQFFDSWACNMLEH